MECVAEANGGRLSVEPRSRLHSLPHLLCCVQFPTRVHPLPLPSLLSPPQMSRSVLLSVFALFGLLAVFVSGQSSDACPTCNSFRVTFVCSYQSSVTTVVSTGQVVSQVLEQFNSVCKTNAQALAINVQILNNGVGPTLSQRQQQQHTQHQQAERSITAGLVLTRSPPFCSLPVAVLRVVVAPQRQCGRGDPAVRSTLPCRKHIADRSSAQARLSSHSASLSQQQSSRIKNFPEDRVSSLCTQSSPIKRSPRADNGWSNCNDCRPPPFDLTSLVLSCTLSIVGPSVRPSFLFCAYIAIFRSYSLKRVMRNFLYVCSIHPDQSLFPRARIIF